MVVPHLSVCSAAGSPPERSGSWQRRDPRYSAKLPVVLVAGHEELSVVTSNVSRRGMLVHTDFPLPERQLIQLRVTLPAGNILKLHGMVVHTFSARRGRPGGAGIQFYAVPPREASAWEVYIHGLPAERALPVDPAPTAMPAEMALPCRRRFTRFPVRLIMTLQTSDDALRVYSQNISKGGVLVETDKPLRLDEAVVVELVHPHRPQHFVVCGIVRRRVHSGGVCAVGVEFTDLDGERREELYEFISADIEEVSDVDLVEAV